jgi:hypothetical protein
MRETDWKRKAQTEDNIKINLEEKGWERMG